MLASLGAEVIRVDPPGGDVTWRIPPWIGPDGDQSISQGPDDIGISYLRKGRGKRSVVLDLGQPLGVDAFRRLAANADVVVENFRPGVMASLGLDYDTLAELNPRLIFASITGFGPDGPDADLASMDLIIQARSGLMAKSGFPDGPPVKAGATVGDQLPAAFCALAVVAALRQRDIDGQGQYIDVSMLDGLVTLLWDEPLDLYRERGFPDRIGNGDPRGILDTLPGPGRLDGIGHHHRRPVRTAHRRDGTARSARTRPRCTHPSCQPGRDLRRGGSVDGRPDHRRPDHTPSAHPGACRCGGLRLRRARRSPAPAPTGAGASQPSSRFRTLPLARSGVPCEVLPC